MTLPELLQVFQLPFMQRALLTILVLALASAVIGLFVSFRSLEFITDGLIHAVFPGLVIGFVLGGSEWVFPAALLAALLAAVLIALFVPVINQDSAIVVVLTSAFSLGIVLVSRQESYISTLDSLLFGHLLTVSESQLWWLSLTCLGAVSLIALTWRKQLYRSHDELAYQAANFSVLKADIVLNCAVAMLVVAGVQALGNLLVIALLLVPTLTARIFSSKMSVIMALSVLITLISGIFGLSLSIWSSFNFNLNASAGALVVLIMIVLFALSMAIKSAALAISPRNKK